MKIINKFENQTIIEFDDSICSIVPDPSLFGGKKITFYKTNKFKIRMLISDLEELLKEAKKVEG